MLLVGLLSFLIGAWAFMESRKSFHVIDSEGVARWMAQARKRRRDTR